ncbi:tetratricopeptide repeat protein [uncultured Abyssibacter sp.]|uniref:tetratricopeptide repeat protein n=1 Tax=uncultured Abyssibacter sp. TaxID=2320202 RepID=UPI0032B28BC3
MKHFVTSLLLGLLLGGCGTLRQEGQREPVWPYPEPPVVGDDSGAYGDRGRTRSSSRETAPVESRPWGEAEPLPPSEPEAIPSFSGPRNLRDVAGPAAIALADQAAAQRQQGDLQGAAAQLERALRIEPRNAFLWLLLGQIHLEQADTDQARQMARRARALASSNPYVLGPAWRIAEAAWRAEGNQAEAAEAARAAEQAELSQT